MVKVNCNACKGSGKYTNGGMIYHDCEVCNGSGKVIPPEKKEFKINKESHHYKEAIKKIKSLKKDMTDEQADELFEFELNNLKDENNANSSEKNDRKK